MKMRNFLNRNPVVAVGAVVLLAGAAGLFAYSQLNWPATLKAKYATPPAATR